ncbi:uncharacterized protein TNCV_1363011 [Trichonephila clavipes]|nr:uncharacterized protein TNCV_1363011 [Trichonephila clavipes]
MDGSQISCAALRALALNSREQLIREQREDPELGHIYHYLENPDDGSVNATICEYWSHYFKLIDGLLFYAKYYTTLGELKVYIPRSLRETIIKEFHDLPLAGHLGKRKTYLKMKNSSEQNNGHKSSKGNAGWEDPRLKREVDSNGSGNGKNIKKHKIGRNCSLLGSEHRDQKRLTPEPKQGIKRPIPSSVSSRNHKYRRPNNHSQRSQPIAGPSHQQDSRQDKSPTVASRHEGSGQYSKARETKTTKDGNRAAERRTVRSKQTTAVRPCPYYYLSRRVRQSEGFPEERGTADQLVFHRTTSGEGVSVWKP